MSRTVSLALALPLLLLPISTRAAESGAGVVAGSVSAKSDGHAIARAKVAVAGASAGGATAAGATAVTDSLGRFRLEGVAPGRVDLAVECPGYQSAKLDAVEVKAGETTPVAASLEVAAGFMERIQVTGTKLPVSVGELPAQADIIDRESIDLRGAQSLTQAIKNVPGLVISTFAGSFESVMLRGLPREDNEFTSTLLLIDGVPQTDSRNSARVVNLPINDASSIEVLRGPSSALYGRTAIGGSVNLLTADPTTDLRADVDLTGGDFGTWKGLGRVSGPAADWGGFYLSGSDESSDGWYEGSNDVTVDRWALFGKLTFAPDPKSSAYLTANTVDSDQGTPTNVPIIDGRLLTDLEPRFDRLTSFNLPSPNYHQDEDRYTGNYTRQIGSDSSLVALLGYRDLVYRFIDDGDVIGSPFDLDAHTVTQYPFEQKTTEDIWYSELRGEIALPGNLESSLLVGGSYEATSGFVAGNLIFTDPDTEGWPIDYLNPVHPPRSEWQFDRFGGSDYDLGSTGIFAQYIAEPGDRWLLMAGGRYDRLDLENTRTFSEGRPHIDDSFDAFSPRLSATYKVVEGDGNPDLSVYASYSEAFKPPRRPSQLTPDDTDVSLDPEDIANYELGIKGSFFEHQLAASAALFHMDRDGVVTQVRQGPFFFDSNAGEHDYEGFEGSLQWTESSKWSAYLNAALYHNRFGHFVIESEDGDTVLTGNRLPIAPDEVWNAGVLLRPGRAFDVTVDVKYQGSVMIDDVNSFELDAYTLVDAAVSWTHQPLRLTLSASNLLDEDYFWNGDISAGESADVGRPRMVLLTAAFSWNRAR